MKFGKKVEQILNEQVVKEIWSAHLYLSMSSWLETNGLKGFANWMRVQYQEEMSHAMKIFDFILARGGHAVIGAIDSVPTEFKGLKHIFEETCKHEGIVTESIHNCFEVAEKERDFSTTNMLQWFIDEQVEEEQTALEILNQIKLIGEEGSAIYLLDKELGTRVFVNTAQSAQ